MEKIFTRDEYLDAMGIDLALELQDDDNASTKVERFATIVTEDIVTNYLFNNYQAIELLNWDSISENRQKMFKRGCMMQASYCLRNGWITLDSGVNGENGIIVDYKKVKMYDVAMEWFRRAGLANIPCYGHNQPLWDR